MSQTRFTCFISIETLFFLILLVMQFAFLDASPIYILDESKFAEAAREMLVSGDYWIPTFNGSLFVDKPPLQYFFMMLGFKIFGINPLGARFFSAVFALLTVWSTYVFALDFFGRRSARITLFVMISAFFFMQQFQLAVPDPYLIFFCCFALFCFYRFYEGRKSIHLLLFYFSLGLGVLSKGPVALALPGLAVGLFLIFRGELRQVFRYQPLTGFFGVLLVALPWYWLIHTETGGVWTQGFFMVHNIGRFSQVMEGHGGPFIVTLGYVLLGLLPFSFFLPQAFKNAYKNNKKPKFLYCLIVGLVFILFFSISATKLPNYTMPCYPFLALLLGHYFDKRIHKIGSGWNSLSLLSLVILALVLPVGAVVGLQMDANLKEVYTLGYALVPTAFITLLALLFLRIKKHKSWFYATGMGWMVLSFLLFGYIYPRLNQINPVVLAQQAFGQDQQFLVYQRMDAAFPFHYQRIFPVVDEVSQIAPHLAEYPNTFLLTNIRDTQVLDTLAGWELVFQKKSVFEYHITKIYQKTD